MNNTIGYASSHPHPIERARAQAGFAGQPWLVDERDACGVGFIASQHGHGSHPLIQQALRALTCVEHRGACSADQDSGDGAGLLTAVPWQLFQSWFQSQGNPEPVPEHTGVGMVFFAHRAWRRQHPLAKL